MKSLYWKNAWLLGGVLLLAFLLLDQQPLIQNMERSFYDWGVRAASFPSLQDRIAIIAVDDDSISHLGRWPWSRNLHAKAVELLAQGKPRQIVNTIFYLEPQADPGQKHLTALKDFLDNSRLKKGLDDQKSMLHYPSLAMDLQTMEQMVATALADLDADQHLAHAMRRAGNVLLAMPFVMGRSPARPSEDLPDYVLKNFIAHTRGGNNQHLPARSASPPLAVLGQEAVAVGHLNPHLDTDGGVRSLPLAIDYYGAAFPSLALLSAARSLNVSPASIVMRHGLGVHVGRIWVQTDPKLRMYPFYYTDPYKVSAFTVDSFHDLVSGRIMPQKYKDKIVLLGVTATGVATRYATPISPAMAPVEILAHAISSILDELFFQTPEWSKPARLATYLLSALYIILLLPRLSAATAALITVLLVLAMAAVHFHLMMQSFLWLPMAGPMAMLVCGYLVVITFRFTAAEEQKILAHAETAESNRMLGLALQSQGLLDMAYEKFLKCPDDPAMTEIFYSLGLDFERHRQFGKAGAVYRHVAARDGAFLDIQERIRHVSSLRDTVGLGIDNAATLVASALPEASGGHATMLGRYQLERELGRGAMGVVYLGRDPKINRPLALKAVSLLHCGDAEEDPREVKRRFFQEAESAGRLNHPNIVTIYDMGEDHDLAYIAMEYVEGATLDGFTRPERLLPLPNVVEIIAKVAAALDYAHRNGVIHRDVKPGNVLYQAEKKIIKLTDFGIARLTAGQGGQTRTGVVMGTPQYMSPEQISGKPLDGRSDIFSLGIMAYQLLTGRLPFPAREITTLVYQITTEPPLPMNQMELVVPGCFEEVLHKALAKNPEVRYGRGLEMAKALTECARVVVSGKMKPVAEPEVAG